MDPQIVRILLRFVWRGSENLKSHPLEAQVSTLDGAEGPLAEYAALRAEILQYNQQHHQLYALHLTITGAILSVAITRTTFSEVTLIIPIVSYMLFLRFLSNGVQIYRAARYINEELSPRVPGGLGWESWLRSAGRYSSKPATVVRLFTFSGTSLLGLIWAFEAAFFRTNAATTQAALVTLWVVELISVAHQVYLITKSFPEVSEFRARPG